MDNGTNTSNISVKTSKRQNNKISPIALQVFKEIGGFYAI